MATDRAALVATITTRARVHDASVLRALTAGKRDQVWGAGAILDEFDDLGVRIAHSSH